MPDDDLDVDLPSTVYAAPLDHRDLCLVRVPMGASFVRPRLR